jgi:hypothetical protein
MPEDRASQIIDKVVGIKSNKSVEDLSFFLRREENLKKILLTAKPEIGAVEALKLTNGNTQRALELVKRIIEKSSDTEQEQLNRVILALNPKQPDEE